MEEAYLRCCHSRSVLFSYTRGYMNAAHPGYYRRLANKQIHTWIRMWYGKGCIGIPSQSACVKTLIVQQPSVVIFYHYLRFMFQIYFYFTEETEYLITLQ